MPPSSPRPPRPARRLGLAVAALAVAGVVALTGPVGAVAGVVALTGPVGAVDDDVPPGPVDTTAPGAAPEGTPRAAEGTTTILTASTTSVVVGDPVTVTATVTPAGSAVVEGGTVDFLVGSTSLGTAVVGPTGEATRNITFTSAGAHAVTASFAGTVEADASTSSPFTITATAAVTPPPTEPTEPTGTARGTGTGTGPAGQTLTVTPNEGLDPAGTEVTVTGTGYTAAAGFDRAAEGMYVALCVDKGPGVVPSPCVGGVDMSGTSGSSKWVTNSPYAGVPPESVAAVAPDGSFAVELTIVAADEFVDCLDLPVGERCVLASRMDHRASADRSQDVKVALCWEGQAACTTDPIPPADPNDPGDVAPFSGYRLTPPSGSRGMGGGLAATGPELRPLPWALALLGLGRVLVLAARRLARRPVPSALSPGGSLS